MDAEGTVLNTTTATFFSVAGPHSVPSADRVRQRKKTVPTTAPNHTAIVETSVEPTTTIPTLSDIRNNGPEGVPGTPRTARPLPSIDKCESDGLRTALPYYVVIGKNQSDGWRFGAFWTSLRGPQTDGRVAVVRTVVPEVSE